MNVITKRATDELELDLGFTLGNFAKRQWKAAISGPIVPGKIKGRISWMDSVHDGYLENIGGGPDIHDV